MKAKFLLPVLAIGLLAGCGRMSNIGKHFHSAMTGLDRKVTLYSSDGKVLKEWRTTAQIEDRGGTVFFIVDGKAVTVSGTFIVEEQ